MRLGRTVPVATLYQEPPQTQTGGFFVMDWLLAFFAGIGIGWMLHDRGKPLALRRAYRFEYKPPVSVLPLDHTEKCRRWTRRFIVFAEVLAHEAGKPDIQLPSRGDYEQATGMSWRKFWPYLEVLEQAGALERRGRAGTFWIVDKPTRRVMTRTAPYPTAPLPRFDFHARAGTDGKQT